MIKCDSRNVILEFLTDDCAICSTCVFDHFSFSFFFLLKTVFSIVAALMTCLFIKRLGRERERGKNDSK